MIRSTDVRPAATALDSWSLESQVLRPQDAALSLRLQLNVLRARTERAIDAVFATLAKRRVRALLVGNDGFFFARREQLTSLCTQNSVAACFDLREHVEAADS